MCFNHLICVEENTIYEELCVKKCICVVQCKRVQLTTDIKVIQAVVWQWKANIVHLPLLAPIKKKRKYQKMLTLSEFCLRKARRTHLFRNLRAQDAYYKHNSSFVILLSHWTNTLLWCCAELISLYLNNFNLTTQTFRTSSAFHRFGFFVSTLTVWHIYDSCFLVLTISLDHNNCPVSCHILSKEDFFQLWQMKNIFAEDLCFLFVCKCVCVYLCLTKGPVVHFSSESSDE